jgi:DNA polymerase-3 subunit beta
MTGTKTAIDVSTAPTTSITDRQHHLKLTVSRETFLSRLGVAVRGASTRSAIQTLSGVLLRVEEGQAELQATDMELGLRVGLEASESSPGIAVVPGRLLLDVVRSLPKDELTLEYRSSHQDVEVVSGPARFHLRTLPPEDFPKLPQRPTEGQLRMPASAFVDTIGRVARAASRDETRPHLTGVLVTASGRDLRMVATDSYRLSVKETTLDAELEGSLEANVPARTLQELARITTWAGAEAVEVTALENQVVFTVDDVVLSSRLVEGRFPNYQQLLPESYEHELRVRRDEVLEVVRRVGLLAQKNAPLKLRFSDGALDVSAQTPDVGEASESLPVPFSGEPLEIGFNPEFFREGLESAESEDLVLKLISPLRPGLIQAGNEGAGFLYLVMPIRLNV